MTKKKIVVIGGGWAGCAAALTAEKAGADVTLLERTDMLLGTGLVGGIFRNNGRYTAAEECIAMGAGDLFTVMEAVATHKNMDFPGHKHATLYNIYKIEPAVKKLLLSRGIKLLMADPAVKTEYEGDTIIAVITKSGLRLTADAFVDVSGSSAMPLNCNKHGNGCAMCILRCHSFGPRVSVTTQSGVEEWTAEKPTGLGAMSGSCKLFKESLAPEIVTELEKTGCCVVPIPEAIKKHKEKLAMKACQQYALDAYADNIVLLDTGSAKLMTPYYPLEELRMIPGFERARFEDPLSGGKGNSMRYFNFAHVDASLKADGKT
ncbi:FAD-dependent oxidoreductase, partial [Phascolarctobacterium faecium]|uniref:FAD-dependent oxidoreductase n=1 Tax=Phascolarctobacterium faecium TaxID=33025 RepID=UPI003FD6E9FE